MRSPNSNYFVSQRDPATTPSNVDWRVRDTYHDLLGLPIPERFIELVESYPEQPQAHSGDEEPQ